MDFYPESIRIIDSESAPDKEHVLFQAFSGISPRRYLELFTADRQDRVNSETGEIVDFEEQRKTAKPRLGQPREEEPSYLTIFPKETVLSKWVLDKVEALYG
jgi:hypothetical protein